MEIGHFRGRVMGVWLSSARALCQGDKVFIKRPVLMLEDHFQRAQEKWTLSSPLLCTVTLLMFYFSCLE